MQIFQNEQFGQIRTIEENGKVLFCGSDVAKALGYRVPKDAIYAHAKGAVKRRTLTNGGEQEMSFIGESDLYRLIAASQLPEAQKFESWVFDEVLPTIRKHGAYMTPEVLEQALLNPDILIKLATTLKEEQEKRKVLEAQNAIMLPKAEYFDELVDRHLLTNFRDTAKELKIAQTELIEFLLNGGYIYRNRMGRLMPYAHTNNDLFEVKECYNSKTDWAGVQTLVTPKGRETFRLLMQREGEAQ